MKTITKKLTQSDIDKAKPQAKRYRLWDDGGLHVLVQPTGVKTYYMHYTTPKGKKKYARIGDAIADTLKEARERAKLWRGILARGEDPAEVLKPKPTPPAPIIKNPTVQEICDAYREYLLPTVGTPPLKNGVKTMGNIDALGLFSGFMCRRISEIDEPYMQKYIDFAKQKRGNKESTINDRLRVFRTMWNWAIKNKLIDRQYQPPEIKKLHEKDSERKVRYLTPDERKRLYDTLADREQAQGRDYLLTAVIIANYTGIRQGALLQLKWKDITRHPSGTWTLHLNPMSAKSTKDYDLPLADRVVEALQSWKKWSETKWGTVNLDDYIIRHGPFGIPPTEIKKSWLRVLSQAGITNFRWHDLRHDFASQLVMSGVPIEQVQSLMTHETIQMTLRYAHLAPSVLQEAANKLNAL